MINQRTTVPLGIIIDRRRVNELRGGGIRIAQRTLGHNARSFTGMNKPAVRHRWRNATRHPAKTASAAQATQPTVHGRSLWVHLPLPKRLHQRRVVGRAHGHFVQLFGRHFLELLKLPGRHRIAGAKPSLHDGRHGAGSQRVQPQGQRSIRGQVGGGAARVNSRPACVAVLNATAVSGVRECVSNPAAVVGNKVVERRRSVVNCGRAAAARAAAAAEQVVVKPITSQTQARNLTQWACGRHSRGRLTAHARRQRSQVAQVIRNLERVLCGRVVLRQRCVDLVLRLLLNLIAGSQHRVRAG